MSIDLLPFYKRLIHEINNVPIRILSNSNIIFPNNIISTQLNSGDVWVRDFMPLALNNGKYINFQYKPSYFLKRDERIRILSETTPNRLTALFSHSNLIKEELFAPATQITIFSNAEKFEIKLYDRHADTQTDGRTSFFYFKLK